MTRTVYFTATSLDGYIADPDNSLDWLFEVAADPPDFAGFFAGIGAFAMGATTYEWILAHENALTEPERWARWYGDTPAWVFTHRDLPAVPGANITFVSGDVRPVYDAMAAAAAGAERTDTDTAGTDTADTDTAGKRIWLVGGGELVGAFVDEDLLDELVLQVAPVTLGGGAPLLPRRLLSSRLRLREVRQVGQFAHLSYSAHGQREAQREP